MSYGVLHAQGSYPDKVAETVCGVGLVVQPEKSDVGGNVVITATGGEGRIKNKLFDLLTAWAEAHHFPLERQFGGPASVVREETVLRIPCAEEGQVRDILYPQVGEFVKSAARIPGEKVLDSAVERLEAIAKEKNGASLPRP